jgi:hypothetical protein
VVSRPSSTGAPPGEGREPVVARVIEFTPRERGLGTAANDNARSAVRYVVQVGGALAFALIAAGGVYFYLS